MNLTEEVKKRMIAQDVDFVDYVKDLLELNMIDDPDAQGVARQIAAQGVDYLTNNQIYTIINKGLLPNNYVRLCKRDGEKIPWEEMLLALDDGLCSWCRKMVENDD